MSEQILVTGGFGYVGGRIAVALAHGRGRTVRLGSRKARLAPDWLPDAETIAMDVLEPSSLPAAMRDIHTVVHLAAMNENECIADPRKALLVNTLGTLNVLQAALDANVKRVVYFSTAHIYGAPLAGHITESTLPRPVHPYATTHRAAEDFVLAAHDTKKIIGIVVRLSNGFGPPTHVDVDRWTLLVNDLCRQAVQSRRMVLRSSGMQQRDFIPLEDAGRAVSHLLGLTREACGDGLFNLGAGNSLTIWEMAQRIATRCKSVLGFTPEVIRPSPTLEQHTPILRYDCHKLEATGFRQQADIEQELDETLLLCSRTWK